MGKKDETKFSSVVNSTLKNSMLTGIPQIASARQPSKKASRAFVFVLCMAGFVYQSKTFLDLYWEYKVVVDVQVTNEEPTHMPAITVCNFHGIQNSRLCANRPSACVPLEDVYYEHREKACTCVDRYCYKNETLRPGVKNMFPDFFHAERIRRLSVDDIQDYVQPASDLFYYCRWHRLTPGNNDHHDCNISEAIAVRAKASETHDGSFCYTLNSLIYKPDEDIRNVSSNAYLNMMLNSNVSEYPLDDILEPIGVIHISIHHPYTVLNPYISGLLLTQRKKYTLKLKKTIRKLLPAPYETNCTDYLKLWKIRGGYGPTNQHECSQECFVNISLAKYGCAPISVDWPNNFPICPDTINTYAAYQQAESCVLRHCRQACYEETYDVEVQALDDIEYTSKECGTRHTTARYGFSYRKDCIQVSIKLNRMETTTYSTKPQYEDIETFSYLGGYVGMWLGISLIAVFDFFETLYILMKYPLSKKFKKQKNKVPKALPTDVSKRF